MPLERIESRIAQCRVWAEEAGDPVRRHHWLMRRDHWVRRKLDYLATIESDEGDRTLAGCWVGEGR